MNNIGVFKDHDYMDDKDHEIKFLEESYANAQKSFEKTLAIKDAELEVLRSTIDNEKSLSLTRGLKIQEQASLHANIVIKLQDELYEVNNLWFNRLYIFITTMRVRSPFYNQS
tara:strand:- start:421 stop:759 length:339 start_codon:yes stop_codon:yes gene_type:complete